MTRFSELPVCSSRFGRMSMIDIGEKTVPRLTLACGYREVEPEECIICTGFSETKAKLIFKIETFIRIVKGKRSRYND